MMLDAVQKPCDERGRGRIVFEVGAACKGHLDMFNGTAFGFLMELEGLVAMQRCVEQHDSFCSDAETAIECWIGVGRRLNVAKDIRLVIARMLWTQRAEWSEV